MTSHPLLLAPGPVDLSVIPTDATPGFKHGKKAGLKAMVEHGPELAELQERLYAEGRVNASNRRILLVLQGMDTSGKGGVLRHTVGLVDPQGVRITSFKKPTPQEAKHHFLWRVRKALPEPGYIGVFDRSHYEDVLIARVEGYAEPDVIAKRYDEINRFEKNLTENGTLIIKCMLHVSREEQRERLLARLHDPTKYWKYNPADLDARAKWDDYQTAYELAVQRTNTDHAPWYVVPSDRKWYRNLAVGELLMTALRGMDLSWPEASFDVDVERARLLAEDASA